MSRPIAECKYCEDDGFITSDFGGMTVQSAPCPKCRHTDFMHWYASGYRVDYGIAPKSLVGQVVQVEDDGVGMIVMVTGSNGSSKHNVEFLELSESNSLISSMQWIDKKKLTILPAKITKKGSVKRIVTVIGRKWFSKMCGNTYHSVTVYVDGQCIGRIPYRYGYGSQYEETALELLQQKGYYTDTTENMLCTVVRKEGDILNSECTQVTRKKDL